MDDYAHKETDKIIGQMERKVADVYKQAEKETQKKLDKYLKQFEEKDEEKRKQRDAKEITEEDYNKWRTGQIMMGKRWEEMRDTLAQDYHNSNDIARSVANGYLPDVYALNHNYATFQVERESRVDTSYTLYDRQTVERLIRDDPELLPAPGEQMEGTFKKFDAYKKGENVELSKKEKKAYDKLIADNKDIRWQKGQIQSVMTQSILQGESIPHMAQRVARTMGETNRKATTRYCRTAATGAQNAGRVDAYKRAESMGIELEQQWLATLDDRTRDEHRELDGTHVPVGEPFEVDDEEIKYPGDPSAAGYLIWNCRCTLVPYVKGVDQSKAQRYENYEEESYEEWRGRQNEQSELIPMEVYESVTVQTASDDWFEYENASYMRSYIKDGIMPSHDMYGEEIPIEERQRLAAEAELIQKRGESTKTQYRTVYRGMVLEEDEARSAFTPGEEYTFDTLSATATDRRVASIYADKENAGIDGVPVIIEIQKPDGVFGYDRDGVEVVIPKGSSFRVVRNYMDNNGVVHISLYSKKGNNLHGS